MGKRIEYMDAMRGFAIFLVVTAHVIIFGFDIVSNTFVSEFFTGILMLPLFFMISGYFSVKPGEPLETATITKSIAKRFPILIVSALIFMSVFCILHGINILHSLSGPSKSGYWYTITLFEFLLLYKAIEYACCLLKCSRRTFSIVIAAAVAAAIIFFPLVDTSLYASSPGVYNALGIFHVKFYCYYLLGVLVHLNIGRFSRLVDKGILPGISIVSIVAILIIEQIGGPIVGRFPFDYLMRIVQTGCSLILTFALFQKAPTLSTGRYIGRFLQTMGSNTLSIYFLHYYFVDLSLSEVGRYFKAYPSPLLEFGLASSIAVVVVTACLILTKVLSLWPVTAYLLGIRNKRN